MNAQATQFLGELETALKGNPHQKEIVAEYKMHIYDMFEAEDIAEEHTYATLVERIGHPKELAKIWKEETAVTPNKMQRLFVLLNSSLFIGGGLLLLAYNVMDWQFIERLWNVFTETATLIVLGYLFFWGLLGYEMGKAFGARGKKILLRTLFICIIPNVMLISFIVFRFIPYGWFGNLLDEVFIILSILITVALFPVSWIGYLWGKKASI